MPKDEVQEMTSSCWCCDLCTCLLTLDVNKQVHNYGFYIRSMPAFGILLALLWFVVNTTAMCMFTAMCMYSLTEKNNLSLA